MSSTDPRIDRYIASAAPFARPILTYLRDIVHQGCPQVEETLKWSMPHFVHNGILCSMAAFQKHCAFGFWRRELVAGAAERDKQAMGQFGRIAAIGDLPSRAKLLGYVRKAAALNAAGVKPPPRRRSRRPPAAVPPDLKAGLARSKGAAAAFAAFSPSQRREYIEWITEARREETRARRLKTALAWIAAAKPRHWKYVEKCR